MACFETSHFALRPTVCLSAGDIQCERIPQLLRTVLGSCVAVCLWDRRQHFGGMSHFILPTTPDNSERSPRFGDVAVPALIEQMLKLGSRVTDLEAKLFGGANVLPIQCDDLAVGGRNIEVAFAALERRGIPVVASRLSGQQGVVLVQCTECGDVWLRRIHGQAAPNGLTAPRSSRTGRAGSALARRDAAARPAPCHTCGMPAQATEMELR
ncbi:MAG: hypothetical protein GC191_11935 [Azospirillum sp.]|nr:hypothetical protein [Azospirillum sp.]